MMTGENKVLINLFILSLPFLYYKENSYVKLKNGTFLFPLLSSVLTELLARLAHIMGEDARRHRATVRPT
jgi:hypothetical protein